MVIVKILAEQNDTFVMTAFTILDTKLIGSVQDGYTAINLKSGLEPAENRGDRNIGGIIGHSPNIPPGTAQRNGSPFESGIINVRYNSAEHYYDLFWASEHAHYVQTESEYALALADEKGYLCGFRNINNARFGDGEFSYVDVALKLQNSLQSSSETVGTGIDVNP